MYVLKVGALVVLAILFMPRQASAEEILHVTVCEVLGNPSAYNHKLIEITGNVSRGFEDFTISDDECRNRNIIWLEMGGLKGSQVMYCCGVTVDPKRPTPLTVETIETSVLDDENLVKFQKLTLPRNGYGRARVTIVGRYFSGKEKTLPGGTFWMGYGHLGMATLLVIQQVKDVQKL